MKTYYARIPRTGWFVRVPRWLYNRWPWRGVVQMPNEQAERLPPSETLKAPKPNE